MKKIVIIGNSDINVDYSTLINSADFVVRFNEARNYGSNSGIKCNALCLTNLHSPGRSFAKYQKVSKLTFIDKVDEIWFPRPSSYLPFQFWIKPFNRVKYHRADYRNHIIKRNSLENKTIFSFSEDIYSSCCCELGIERDSIKYFPSTGYLAIKYVLERFKKEDFSLDLIGFSFEGTSCHKWETEKSKLTELHNTNVIRII